MASTILQKRKAARLLKKIGGSSDFDFTVVDGILDEVEDLHGKIPKMPDLSPLKQEAKELGDKISDHTLALNLILDEIQRLNDGLHDAKSGSVAQKEEQQKLLNSIKEDLSSEISNLKKLYQNLRLGGGAMPRQWQINGSIIMTRYADVNFIVSGWSAANNDTYKRTDITITGGGGSTYQAPISGNLGQNTFTWTTAPNVIVIDQQPYQKVSTDGSVNWTGTTTTVLTISPLNDIYSPA